jgi:hypothetical protein
MLMMMLMKTWKRLSLDDLDPFHIAVQCHGLPLVLLQHPNHSSVKPLSDTILKNINWTDLSRISSSPPSLNLVSVGPLSPAQWAVLRDLSPLVNRHMYTFTATFIIST